MNGDRVIADEVSYVRTFAAIRDPAPEMVREAVALAPRNPFTTVEYAAARRALGAEPWLLGLKEGGRLTTGCLAFLASGRLTRSVEIPSWPGPEASDPFFERLLQWCHGQSVSRLELNSFCSEAPRLPPWRGRSVRRARAEYILDLTGAQWRVGSNHARNIKRAQRAGVTLCRSTERSACREHALVMTASLARRRDRGEDVGVAPTAQAQPPELSQRPSDGQWDVLLDGQVPALVAHGAGELFQALVGDRLVSSILVLRASKGGYYHSAGTTAEGMACGASHWLVQHIAQTLQSEGLERFNLGGADEDGLVRFKIGFGSARVELEAADIQLAGPLMGLMTACGRSLGRLAGPMRELRLAWRGARPERTR